MALTLRHSGQGAAGPAAASPTGVPDGAEASREGPAVSAPAPAAGIVSFRDPSEGDEAVVRRAHVAHRQATFATAGLPPETTIRLCEHQHDMQERQIAHHHPKAERRTILRGGVAVGRLCVDRSLAPWRIVDLVLVPEAQGHGVGRDALGQLLDEATRAGAGVDLHVAGDNARAEALYRRLGFAPDGDAGGPQRRMVWSPSGPPSGAGAGTGEDDDP